MPPRSRAGVTFPQVAAVLAIIAFVAAVIFPVFQKVRERPHNSCQSDMKQLGLAMTQYMQDADENFPAGVNTAGNGWAGQLYPFVKSTSVYQCPDDAAEGKFISYTENLNLVKQNSAKLTNPTATVVLYEFTTLNCDPATAEIVSATGVSAPQDSKRHYSPSFPYALHFLSADGHVRFLAPSQVSGGLHAVGTKGLPQGPGGPVETFAIK